MDLDGDIDLIVSESINKNQNKELFESYDWFYKVFMPSIKEAVGEFLPNGFDLRLISLSENVNILFQGDEYFVTKIRVTKDYDVFFRCSSDAIKLILDNIFEARKKFSLPEITELEAKIISSFNDNIYEKLSPNFVVQNQSKQKRKNFDTIHLTILLKDNKDSCGKLIISIPKKILEFPKSKFDTPKLDIYEFKTSQVPVNIKIGTTKFSLQDLKNLEVEDLVIFESSEVNSLELVYGNWHKKFRTTFNHAIMTTINENNIGGAMEGHSESQNLWDNIQVEMGAEFDKVKITLGELKNIEEGLVVDISSVYDNKVSLKVEDKIIAKGELVIINDRYGVRVDEVFASQKHEAEDSSHEISEIEPSEEASENEHVNVEDEFDYSDFEIDDQDI